jgi:hypothetical protein
VGFRKLCGMTNSRRRPRVVPWHGTFGKEMSYEDARFDKADNRALYMLKTGCAKGKKRPRVFEVGRTNIYVKTQGREGNGEQ